MPENPEFKNPYGTPVEQVIQSGTDMAQLLWRNVAEIKTLKDDLKGMLPDPSSWKHPENARKAVEAQLEWSERTLVRTTLDYMDARKDTLLAALSNTEIADTTVTIPTNKGMRKVALRACLEDAFKDIRKSVLRHDNAYFRQMRYFFEIQISGGQIPPFKTSNHEEAEAV
jgi:hypothetical protein